MQAIAFQLRMPRRSRSRSGFTLMELIMGMIVTGLVMSAIAALISAVAVGWEHSGSAQADSSQRVQAHARVQRIVKGVKQLAALRAGSIDGTVTPAAALLIWKSDNNGDEKPQFSELALLIHQGAVGTPEAYLSFYQVEYPAEWTDAQKTEADNTPSPITHDEIFLDESITSFLAADHVQKTRVASNLVGVVFKRTDGVEITRPSLDYVLKFSKDNYVHVEYGTASVRPAAALPPSQR